MGVLSCKASAEISEKSSGNQKSQRDFEISYGKTARVGPLERSAHAGKIEITRKKKYVDSCGMLVL